MIILHNSDTSRPIVLVYVPTQITGNRFICLVNLLKMGLGDLIVFDGMFVRVHHFRKMTVSLFDLLVGGGLGKLQYFVRVHLDLDINKDNIYSPCLLTKHKYIYIPNTTPN